MPESKSKKLNAVSQRRKILEAGLDLIASVNDIARKHDLTEADVTEVVKDVFDSCFNRVLSKDRRI